MSKASDFFKGGGGLPIGAELALSQTVKMTTMTDGTTWVRTGQLVPENALYPNMTTTTGSLPTGDSLPIDPTSLGQGTSWIRNLICADDIAMYGIKEGNSSVIISSLVMGEDGKPTNGERLSDASYTIGYLNNKLKGAFIENGFLYLLGYYTSTAFRGRIFKFSLDAQNFGDPTYVSSWGLPDFPDSLDITGMIYDKTGSKVYVYCNKSSKTTIMSLDFDKELGEFTFAAVSATGEDFDYANWSWNTLEDNMNHIYSYSNNQYVSPITFTEDAGVLSWEVGDPIYNLYNTTNRNYGSFATLHYSYNEAEKAISTNKVQKLGGSYRLGRSEYTNNAYYIRIN